MDFEVVTFSQLPQESLPPNVFLTCGKMISQDNDTDDDVHHHPLAPQDLFHPLALTMQGVTQRAKAIFTALCPNAEFLPKSLSAQQAEDDEAGGD